MNPRGTRQQLGLSTSQGHSQHRFEFSSIGRPRRLLIEPSPQPSPFGGRQEGTSYWVLSLESISGCSVFPGDAREETSSSAIGPMKPPKQRPQHSEGGPDQRTLVLPRLPIRDVVGTRPSSGEAINYGFLAGGAASAVCHEPALLPELRPTMRTTKDASVSTGC